MTTINPGLANLMQRQVAAVGNHVFVTDENKMSVVILDIAEGEVQDTETFPVYRGAMSMKPSPANDSATVLVHDRSDARAAGLFNVCIGSDGNPWVDGPLPIESGRYHVRAFDVDAQNGTIYYANETTGHLHMITPGQNGTLIGDGVADRVVKLDAAPTHVAADRDGVFVIQSGNLFRIGRPIEGDLDLSKEDFQGRHALNKDRVHTVDAFSVKNGQLVADDSGDKKPLRSNSVPVGGASDQYEMAVLPQSHTVGVLNRSTGQFQIRWADGSTFRWQLAPGEHQLGVNANTGRFMVTNSAQNTADEYDAMRHPQDTDNPHTFETGPQPGNVVIDASTGVTYIKNGDQSMTMIDAKGEGCLINAASAEVDGGETLESLAEGNQPLAVDEKTHAVFIANPKVLTRQAGDGDGADMYSL
jgi:hypothetical protein